MSLIQRKVWMFFAKNKDKWSKTPDFLYNVPLGRPKGLVVRL